MKSKPRVLIAEDDDLIRAMLRVDLLDRPFEANFVRNGAEAVALYRSACEHEDDRFDLLLLDVMMPVSSGLDAAEEIRVRSCDRNVKIVFFTNGDVRDPLTLARIKQMDLDPQCVLIPKNDFIQEVPELISRLLGEEA